MLLADEDDNLYNEKSYTIIHNGNVYTVDPLPMMRYSRVFSEYFQKNPRKCSVKDDFSEQAFETYLWALQEKPVAPSATALVDLLLISEAWESRSLIKQIESIINTKANPNEIIRLYIKLLDSPFSPAKLEEIISLELPRYLECKLFPTLQFPIIERMISNYPGRLNAIQIIKLCYAASAFCGLDSIGFIKKTSFDNMTREEIIEIADQFEKCPFPQLHDFLVAMSHLIRQLLRPINSDEKFDQTWMNADTGHADEAFSFYKLLIDDARPKKKKEKKSSASRTFTRTGTHSARTSTAFSSMTSATSEIDEDAPPPNYEEPQNPTQMAFLRAAAERGNADAQYIYGKYLFNHRVSEGAEDSALEFLIQAAAKGSQEARDILSPFFSLTKVNVQAHTNIYRILGLQNLLLNIDSENFDTSKLAIAELNYNETEEGIVILAQNIMKAVQVRQRNQKLYAKLISYLSDVEYYESLKQAVFTVIMSSMYVADPMHQQLVYIQFLRLCYDFGTLKQEEFVGPLLDFLRSSNTFLKSALIIFYFFADTISEVDDEIFAYLKMKLFNFQSGLGNMDELLKSFKDHFVELMKEDGEEFKKDRREGIYKDPLSLALINDDLKAIRKLKFDPTQRIKTRTLDLSINTDDGSYGTEEMLPIQFAACQGSQATFLWLLRRMPDFSIRDDIVSATCCCAGQNKFILGFITGLSDSFREEMFRMAAKWNNMYLMILLLQGNINVNCVDDCGNSALHFATRNGNQSIVEFLANTEGIDINCPDQNGVTPLHYAVFLSKLDVAKVLANAKGIDLNVKDKHGSSPLHYAVWNNDFELVKFLTSLPGINVNITAKLNRTPLHEAAKCGFLELIQILGNCQGINMNAQDKNGRTPLKLAMKRGQSEVVKYLDTLESVIKQEASSTSSGRGDDTGDFSQGFLQQD